MTRQIIKFLSSGNIEIIPVSNETLGLEFIRKHIGYSDGTSFMECVYNQFPERKNVVYVCDGEGKLKGMPLTVKLVHDTIVGDCFVASVERCPDGEFDIFGLNESDLFDVLLKICHTNRVTIWSNS